MIFLGQASNYTFPHALKHLFTRGKPKYSQQLRIALANRYHVESNDGDLISRIALYHTGRSALTAALIATVPKGSRVIIQGLTCIAVVRAVKAAGCEPVFVDIGSDYRLQYDLDKLAQTLATTDNVSAIIVQNTLGLTIDIAEVEKLTKKYKIRIIEDLAHCAGRFYPDGREVGTVGVACALSFGKGKAIDTISGGALVLREPKYPMVNQPALPTPKSDQRRDRFYPIFGALMRLGYDLSIGKFVAGALLKLHFIQRSADAELNLDVRLTDWQAKLALEQLEKLPTTPLREPHFVGQREKVLEELLHAGFKLDEIWYDTPVSPARYKKEVAFPTKDCPNTVKVAKTIVNLPTWYSAEKVVRAREIVNWYELKEAKRDDED